MADRLKGKKAIVTGGSRGIGEAIATAFAKEGAKVVIVSRKQESLDEVAEKINSQVPESVLARACHQGKIDQVEALCEWANATLGRVDILVNNAATNPYFGPMLDIPEVLFDKTFEVNLKGPFELTRRVTSMWREQQKPGSVINISSVAGTLAAPLQGVYGMTKAAMIAMTKTLAVELGPAGIRVNSIAPGLIDTKLSQAIVSSPDLVKIFNDHTALKRHGQPEEIAGLAVYLASDEASFVTGQTICADGGYTIA